MRRILHLFNYLITFIRSRCVGCSHLVTFYLFKLCLQKITHRHYLNSLLGKAFFANRLIKQTPLCLFVFFLCPSSNLQAFEKLSSVYHVSFGNTDAPVYITEYFSLTCPKCLAFIKKDFPLIKQKYIDTNKVFWIFHPDPSDLLTLQFLVCLEKLRQEKTLFFETTLHFIEKDLKTATIVMQSTMECLKEPLPDLGDLSFLEKTRAFREAYRFLKQEDLFTLVPTVEINGKLYDQFPTRKFLEKQIEIHLKKQGQLP